MGAASSTAKGRGLVLSFDALGTLYRFREPVATQYLKVAKTCGLKAAVRLPDLERSFRSAFKSVSAAYPNYGKGVLDDPESWWTKLVNQAFEDVANGEELPENLGSQMYQHFSSAAAYELYPDVRPFLELVHNLRRKFPGADDPMIITGIITNSDPRVAGVLRSMNLRIGPAKVPNMGIAHHMLQLSQKREDFRRTGLQRLQTPWHECWNSENDFDFLMTSYEAGSEKPDKRIFYEAWRLAGLMPSSRAEQEVQNVPDSFSARMALARSQTTYLRKIDDMTWIHIGDDYPKDYQGAIGSGIEALHLVREGEGDTREGAKTVTSLDEVAAIINILAAQNFEA